MEWPSSTADPAHTLTGLTRSQDSHADRTHTQTRLTRCPQDWATRTSYDLRHLAIQNGVEYQRKVNGTWKPLSRADVVRGLTTYYASPNTSEATSPIRQRRRQRMFKTRLKRTNTSTQAAIGTAPTAVAAANLKRDQRHLATQNGVEYQRKVNGTWKPLSKEEVVRSLTAYYASPKMSEATSPRRQRQR